MPCHDHHASRPLLTQRRTGISDDHVDDNNAGQGLDLSEFFESTEGCFTTPQVKKSKYNLSFGRSPHCYR